MKEFPVEPGSDGWLGIRLGIPTASNAHRILTPATRKFSKQSRKYAFYLVAEKLLNMSLGTLDHIEHIQRGKDLEPDAVRMFEAANDIATLPVGFLTTDDMTLGATPDRRIANASAFLECKCPTAAVHLEYLIDGFGADYMAQVQCQAYVGEAEWVMRWSYHPAMPPALIKTYRDDGFIADLQDAVAQFNDMRAEIERRARETGFFDERLAMGNLALDQLTGDELS